MNSIIRRTSAAVSPAAQIAALTNGRAWRDPLAIALHWQTIRLSQCTGLFQATHANRPTSGSPNATCLDQAQAQAQAMDRLQSWP
jgi:hypothetical protein